MRQQAKRTTDNCHIGAIASNAAHVSENGARPYRSLVSGPCGRGEEVEEGAREETLWTAVGFSAGAFNAVNSGAGTDANTFADANFLSAANSSLSNESSASGVSYSIGLNVGGKVARRWVLQGGVNYLTNYAEFTSNAVVTDLSNFKAATSVELNKLSTSSTSRDKVVPTAPYSVTSNLEYIKRARAGRIPAGKPRVRHTNKRRRIYRHVHTKQAYTEG
ncbi:MAG: hypothetical protein HC859_14470 [Bacteroidia bacterium]|nr:hypothetical protein [Bacteroidia bacterium]